MDLSSLVRKAVATADAMTGSLQVSIQHQTRKSTSSDYGAPDYESSVARSGLVERRHRMLRTPLGDAIESLAKVTFTTPCGVKEGDLITLPEGDTWPVLQVSGPIDPKTQQPFIEEAYLGATQRG